ncbi:MAG: radical SAM protein [bacterium]|nr:radical SAM protein [bacterium]
MKICIVYPPFWHVDNQPGIEAVQSNYGVFPNLSLAYVAGSLLHAGHSVRFIDANALNLSKEEVLARVKRYAPDLIAMTVTTYMIHQNLSWIRYLKQNLDIPVIVGGQHLSLYPYETFTHKEIDYGIVGEAEETIVDFLDALEKGEDLSKVDSIIFRDKDGKVIKTGNGRMVKDLDNVPYPARELLPNDRYFEFITQRKNFSLFMTSRGCPYLCIYCEQGKTRFRGRTAKNVADEIEEIYHDHKIRELDIFDPMFTTQKQRVMDICKELEGRKLDVEFAIRSRVDTVNKEMLEALKRAGCSRIYYGIETGSQKIMDTLKKGVKTEQVKKAIVETDAAGIKALGYFMIGHPGENASTVKETINLALRLPLHYAQFSKVTPLPGTELYDVLMLPELEGKDYWREYVLDASNSRVIGRPQCDMSEKEIQKWVKTAYMKFYFRPKYIAKAVGRLRSLEEFKRSAHAAADIFKFKPSSEAVGE